MPLFRFTVPPPGLEDATYLYEVNPDPERYSEVTEVPAPLPVPPAAPPPPAPAEEPAEPAPPTEETP